MEQNRNYASRSNANRNSKSQESEKVLSRVRGCSKNLTPLIRAQATQHMALITVNEENFVTATTNRHKQEGASRLRSAGAEVVAPLTDVFDRPLGTFPGKVSIEVEPNAESVVIPPRRVLTALKEKLKDELGKLVDEKIIAPIDQPTPWVNSLVVTTKKSDVLRICVDPRHLNRAPQKGKLSNAYSGLDEILLEVAQAKVCTTVDLQSGFWHCVLSEESSRLTTFDTPYRRFHWLRQPFGLSVSPEIFQKRVNQVLEGLEGILNIADILVYGEGDTVDQASADHGKKLEAILLGCRECGVALNKEKHKLRVKRVKFMGHVLTDNGLQPDPEKIEALKEMPKPQSAEDAQHGQRYAQIEEECLAIVYSLERFHQYTFSRNALLHSDHKRTPTSTRNDDALTTV